MSLRKKLLEFASRLDERHTMADDDTARFLRTLCAEEPVDDFPARLEAELVRRARKDLGAKSKSNCAVFSIANGPLSGEVVAIGMGRVLPRDNIWLGGLYHEVGDDGKLHYVTAEELI